MRPSPASTAVLLLPALAVLALTVSAEAGPEYFPIKPVSEKGETLIVASDRHTEFSLDGKSWSPAVPTATCTCWATLPGATWIWRVAKVSAEETHNGSPVVTFRRTFAAPAGVTRALLRITADNAYKVSLNGAVVGESGELKATSSLDDSHWRAIDTYAVALKPGENVITVQAVNYHSTSTTAGANPAGIVFSLATPSP